MTTRVFPAICAALLLALSARAGEDRRFEIAIRDNQVPEAMQVVRVSRGDHVELVWTTDKPARLHFHGYDMEFQVAPGTPAVVDFDARATGRFPVELHGSSDNPHGHDTLLYVEVYPE